MTTKNQIIELLNELHPSEAIAMIESIGKELRRKNSIRINKGIEHKSLDLGGRPDFETLKKKK
jgi:hypothetical protein